MECSVSSLMTTTEAIVVELPKDEETPAMGGGGMGGMGGMDYWQAHPIQIAAHKLFWP